MLNIVSQWQIVTVAEIHCPSTECNVCVDQRECQQTRCSYFLSVHTALRYAWRQTCATSTAHFSVSCRTTRTRSAARHSLLFTRAKVFAALLMLFSRLLMQFWSHGHIFCQWMLILPVFTYCYSVCVHCCRSPVACCQHACYFWLSTGTNAHCRRVRRFPELYCTCHLVYSCSLHCFV